MTCAGCSMRSVLAYTTRSHASPGLDYYMRTVFEFFVSDDLGGPQSTVLGGGPATTDSPSLSAEATCRESVSGSGSTVSSSR